MFFVGRDHRIVANIVFSHSNGRITVHDITAC
jgi:hypothetical protein